MFPVQAPRDAGVWASWEGDVNANRDLLDIVHFQ